MVSWEYAELVFWGNTINEYIVAAGVFILVWATLWTFKNFFLHRLHQLAKKTASEIDDILISVLKTFSTGFYFVFSLYISSQFLDIVPKLEKGIWVFFLVAATYYGSLALINLINASRDRMIEVRDDNNESLLIVLSRIIKGVIWVGAALFFLSNIGINITSFIAGLGIGGVAIAIALQNILGDIFASFSIYFDQPFEIGDFVVLGDDMGTVEHIGIKSTRIKALQGHELVISNKELTSTRIKNYKQMDKRRATFDIGVTYGTPHEKAKKIPEIIEGIIKDIELTEMDRVHLKEFGDSALNYEVVYYVLSNDYNDYMDAQQDINFQIMEAFEDEGIEFAYPTRTIMLEEQGGEENPPGESN